ncbi:MAG: HK97-gp10 family putative phage morphogenesis protein [Actinomycetota bacterium]
MTNIDRNFAGAAVVLEGHEVLIRQLQQAGRSTSRKVRSRMRRVGAKAVERAKSNAPRLHGDLADSIKLVIDRRGVVIRAGGRNAPYAHVFEQPGRGSAGRKQARHPVFARGPRRSWTWHPEPRQAFIEPAIEESRDDVGQALADAARDALHGAGIPTT